MRLWELQIIFKIITLKENKTKKKNVKYWDVRTDSFIKKENVINNSKKRRLLACIVWYAISIKLFYLFIYLLFQVIKWDDQNSIISREYVNLCELI